MLQASMAPACSGLFLPPGRARPLEARPSSGTVLSGQPKGSSWRETGRARGPSTHPQATTAAATTPQHIHCTRPPGFAGQLGGARHWRRRRRLAVASPGPAPPPLGAALVLRLPRNLPRLVGCCYVIPCKLGSRVPAAVQDYVTGREPRSTPAQKPATKAL